MRTLLIALCIMILLVIANAQESTRPTRVSVTIIYSNVSMNEASAIISRAKMNPSKPTIFVGTLRADSTIGSSINIR